MQSGGEDLSVNPRMQMVRRTVMHHLQSGMRQQRLNATVGVRHVELARLLLRHLQRTVAQRHHLDVAHPAQRFQMRQAR